MIIETRNLTYRATGRMVVRRIGKDRLLVPVSGAVASTHAVFPLNDTGVFLWERISNGTSEQEAARELTAAFAVSPDQAAEDVLAFVDRLMQERLVEPVTP